MDEIKSQPKSVNYSNISHSHCYTQKNPPCGLKGHHCCLCDIVSAEPKPVEQAECGNRCDSCNGPILSHHKVNQWHGLTLHTACYGHATQTERLLNKMLATQRKEVVKMIEVTTEELKLNGDVFYERINIHEALNRLKDALLKSLAKK